MLAQSPINRPIWSHCNLKVPRSETYLHELNALQIVVTVGQCKKDSRYLSQTHYMIYCFVCRCYYPVFMNHFQPLLIILTPDYCYFLVLLMGFEPQISSIVSNCSTTPLLTV